MFYRKKWNSLKKALNYQMWHIHWITWQYIIIYMPLYYVYISKFWLVRHTMIYAEILIHACQKKKNPADKGSKKLQLNKPPHFYEKRWHSEKSAFYITNSCYHKLNRLKNSNRFFLIIKLKHISLTAMCLKFKDLIKSTIITLFL